jgi:membrane protein implicated in regulation of membrane protease activity
MKKFFIEYGFVMWFGVSLGVVGLHLATWQFWFVIVPTLFLLAIRDYFQKNS